MDALFRQIDFISRSLDEHERLALPVPPWLQKQLDGIVELETDWNRGIAMLIDGLSDYRDLLDKAEYVPYPSK